ncbi:MAG TPA: LuxR C-terminal-related transcriptional regulator [Solirubrobacteraceae bacterium]|nr:LuxR C-terminal-related transcriptional regulator [Solirubrobacteraceae bacterium]
MRRERLFERLDQGVRRPLTLLAAPPGAGKTALLGSWIAAGRAPGPVAWLSLDPSDGERRRFWRAVLEALNRASGRRSGRVRAPSAGRVDLLLGALAASLPADDRAVVLVLDDFHEVADTVHADLERLLRRPLPALRVVIASRADPPLHLGRLRLQDQLAEIRSPDLAFTLAETAELLGALGIEVDDDDVRRLWMHTEGWVGAIRLAAMSLRDHPEPARFIADFAGDDRAISDYLLSEVMSAVSEDDREFLLRTAVAGVLNGELADALTGARDGRRRLADLAGGGALLAPIDRRGEWYRYHALFAELLRAELRSERPDEVAGLHRRAAAWLADNGDDARGLLHAVEAGAWDLAARLAGERWIDLLIQGEIAALRPLVDRIPAERVEADPELALALASALVERGDEVSAEAELHRAERGRDRVPAERLPRFDVSLAAIRLYVARLRGDLEAALAAGRDVARGGGLEPGVVEGDLRALALINLGIAELWSGDLDEAERRLQAARGAAAEAGRDWLVFIALSHLAMVAGARYDFARAERQAQEAIELAERHGWERTWSAGGAYLALTTAAFLSDRLDDAEQMLTCAQDALADTRERPLRAVLSLLRSGVLTARGDHETALAVVVAGAEALGDWPVRSSIREQFGAHEALLRAELGERAQAVALLASGQASLPGAVVLAQLQLGDGEHEAARAALDPWREHMERERSPACVQAWLLDALALDALADHDAAAAALEAALDRAEPSGLRWALLAFGRSLQPLLRRQQRRGTAHAALVGEIVSALDRENGHAPHHAELMIEPLSPRERAVLRYLPTMMSNQEIASELFVSVNTVKTHLKAIYRKLDVPDRREAVRRARTMNLLAP